MTTIEQSPQALTKWFGPYKNSTLQIRKEENGDKDIAELELKDVDVTLHKDHDDYLSAQALLLKAVGTVATDLGKESLPYNFYEIPLTDHWSASADQHTLRLDTERGHYIIRANGNGPN